MKPIYEVGETVGVSLQRNGAFCDLIGEVIAICPNYYVVKLDDGTVVEARAKQVSYYNRAWDEDENSEE